MRVCLSSWFLLGASSGGKYTFEAIFPQFLGSKAYYRLKQIDFDGNFSCYDVVSVSQSSKNNADTTVFRPVVNAEQQTLWLAIESASDQTLVLSVCGIFGRFLVQKNVFVASGSQNIVEAMGSFSRGFYVVRVSNPLAFGSDAVFRIVY